MTAVETAAVFRSWYHDRCGSEIDEMKLHKLLYLAQRESLIVLKKPLFREKIYAWQYGPVIPEVRRAYKLEDFPSLTTFSLPPKELSVLDYIFNTYAEKDSWSLSRLTHAEYSWQHAREQENSGGGFREMPIADIQIAANQAIQRRESLAALGLV